MKANKVYSMSKKINSMLLNRNGFNNIMLNSQNGMIATVGAAINSVIDNQAALVDSYCNTAGSIVVYALIEHNTGKVYVGETAHPIMRWNQEMYMHGRIGESMRNYKNLLAGFGIVILSVESCKKDSQTKEKQYIQLFNTCNTNFGYNVVSRGPVLSQFKRENKKMLTNVSKKPNTHKFVADVHIGASSQRVMFSSMKQCVSTTGLPLNTVRRAVHRANKIKWTDAKELSDLINTQNSDSVI